MTGIEQLCQLPPARVHEQGISRRQSAQVAVCVTLVSIIKARTTEMKCHVQIKLVAGRIIVVHIPRHGHPVDASFQTSIALPVSHHMLRCVEQAKGHFAQAIPIGVIKKKRIFPIQPQIINLFRAFMNLEKSGLPVIVGKECRTPSMQPATQLERGIINIAHRAIIVRVDKPHVVPAALHLLILLAILHDDHHGRIARLVTVHPINNQVSITAIYAVPVSVNHQTAVACAAFQVAITHRPVVVNPLYGSPRSSHRPKHFRPTVIIQVYVLRLMPGRRRRQTKRNQKVSSAIPVKGVFVLSIG